MKPITWAAALAAVALCLPGVALAQKKVGSPAATVPQSAVCFGELGAACVAVTPSNPLPVTGGGGGGGGAITASDGAIAAIGAKADAACGSDAGTCSELALIKRAIGKLTDLVTAATDTTPVATTPQIGGSAAAGGTGAASAATQRIVVASDSVIGLDARASGGCTPYGYQSAASTNATSIKASAGTLCGGMAVNTTSTLYYARLYNLATAPTCSSATGYVMSIPIPANTSGAGVLIQTGAYGWAFSTGLAFCLTGGASSTDNTSAATGVFLTLGFK